MSTQNRNAEGLGPRLRRLPGQFLLALVNATAILVIAAAVLAIIAVSRLESTAGRVTDAVLAEIDVRPQDALDEIRDLSAEIQELRTAIANQASDEGSLLEPAIERFDARLHALQGQLNGLTEARRAVIRDGLESIAASLAEVAERLAGCRVEPKASKAG